jgi:hypothetical protein
VSKLRRLWDGVLPGLIYLDPMVTSAYGVALIEDQDGHANAVRHAPVSYAPTGLGLPAISGTPSGSPDISIRRPAWILRRPRATLMLVSSRGSDVSRVSTGTQS